jgi:hypothetical protein
MQPPRAKEHPATALAPQALDALCRVHLFALQLAERAGLRPGVGPELDDPTADSDLAVGHPPVAGEGEQDASE